MVNLCEIPGEQLLGISEILTPLISGTHGLIFLIRALIRLGKVRYGLSIMAILGTVRLGQVR